MQEQELEIRVHSITSVNNQVFMKIQRIQVDPFILFHFNMLFYSEFYYNQSKYIIKLGLE